MFKCIPSSLHYVYVVQATSDTTDSTTKSSSTREKKKPTNKKPIITPTGFGAPAAESTSQLPEGECVGLFALYMFFRLKLLRCMGH